MTVNPDDPRATGLHPDLRGGARWDDQGRRLCSARNRFGEPCEGPALHGQRVCRFHGGSTQRAKNRAKLRLLELVDPAITTLAREMAAADRSVDRQRAANSILDRAGWGRVTKVETADARDILVRRLLELREQHEVGGGDPAPRLTPAPDGEDDDE